MRVERYSSVESYARLVNDACPGYRYYDADSAWYGGLGFDQAVKRTREGDPTVVANYRAKVDGLLESVQMAEIERGRYEPSVCGTRVNVPDYLAGNPQCMRRKFKRPIENRSVRIYVSTTCAAGITADQMMARGATILALCEHLQMSQYVVELSLLAETHGKTDGDLIQVIQVETPLNLSTAGFAIAHPAFARHLTYRYAEKIDGFNGCWGKSHYYGNYEQLLREALGMQPGDVYIPAVDWWKDRTIIENPQEWLRLRISQIMGSPS